MRGWLTVEEAATRLRRHPELVYRWLREKRLVGKKFGTMWAISEDELARFKKDQPERRKKPK